MNPRPATFDPTVRRSIEDEIERLISLLDFLSPDPDLEDCADGEPWLSWPERGPGAAGIDNTDCELDDADDEDGGDTELNGDECDLNGDEGDFSQNEDYSSFSGSRPGQAKRIVRRQPPCS